MSEKNVGENLPVGMVSISKMILYLQSIMDNFGDTCVYIRPGVSWGSVALNRQAEDEKTIEEAAISFSEKFKQEHIEMARKIMSHAISTGWTRGTVTPNQEISFIKEEES